MVILADAPQQQQQQHQQHDTHKTILTMAVEATVTSGLCSSFKVYLRVDSAMPPRRFFVNLCSGCTSEGTLRHLAFQIGGKNDLARLQNGHCCKPIRALLWIANDGQLRVSPNESSFLVANGCLPAIRAAIFEVPKSDIWISPETPTAERRPVVAI